MIPTTLILIIIKKNLHELLSNQCRTFLESSLHELFVSELTILGCYRRQQLGDRHIRRVILTLLSVVDDELAQCCMLPSSQRELLTTFASKSWVS